MDNIRASFMLTIRLLLKGDSYYTLDPVAATAQNALIYFACPWIPTKKKRYLLLFQFFSIEIFCYWTKYSDPGFPHDQTVCKERSTKRIFLLYFFASVWTSCASKSHNVFLWVAYAIETSTKDKQGIQEQITEMIKYSKMTIYIQVVKTSRYRCQTYASQIAIDCLNFEKTSSD